MMTTTTATATTATAATATTTTTAIAAITVQQAVALAAFATLLLIGLLVAKELLVAYAAEDSRKNSWKARAARLYAANLNLAILPLAFVFALVVVTKVAAVL